MGKKIVSPINIVGNIGCPHGEKIEVGPLSHIINKNSTQNGLKALM
jgi:hypothetical protein